MWPKFQLFNIFFLRVCAKGANAHEERAKRTTKSGSWDLRLVYVEDWKFRAQLPDILQNSIVQNALN